MFLFLLCLLCLVVVASAGGGAAYAAEGQTTFSVHAVNWPPLAFVDKGRPVGVGVDIVQEAARRIGADTTWTMNTLVEAVHQAEESSRGAVLPLLRTERLEERFKWVGPLAHERIGLFARKDAGIILSGLEAAKHVGGIAYVEGQGVGEMLEAMGFRNLVPHASAVQCVDSLRYGRVDLWITSEIAMPSLARQAGAEPEDFHNVQDVAELPAYMAFSVSTPDDVVDKWQGALDAMRREGVLERYEAIWHPATVVGGVPYALRSQALRLTPEEQAWIAEKRTVSAGGVTDFPPFGFIGPTGRWDGILVDLVHLLEDRTGLVFDIDQARTWPEVLSKAQAGQLDVVLGTVRTPEREQYLRFTDPFLEAPSVVITQDDTPFIAGLEDLDGKVVAVADRYYTHERLRKDYPYVKLLVADNVQNALTSVSVGEAFAYVGDLVSASFFIRSRGLGNLKVAARTRYGTDSFRLAVASDQAMLYSILQKALASISRQERDGLTEKWVRLRYDGGIRSQWEWQLVGWGAVALSVALAVALWWMRKLRKEIERRGEVERRLAEREQRYRDLFENAQAGILVGDAASGRVHSANQRMAELFGFSSLEDFKERVTLDRLCGSEGDLYAALHSDERFLNVYCEVEREDGERVWVDWGGKADPETGLVTVVAQDVSERLEAENRLRAKEGMMNVLVDAMPFFVAFIGPDRRFRLINSYGAEMLGRTVQDVVGLHVSEILPPEVWAVFKPYEDKALAGEHVTVALESDYARRGGYYLGYYSPQLDPLGAVLGVAICLVDITTQKHAEEALRASEERYRSVVERSNDAIVIVSTDGRLLLANAKASELFGYTLEEALGMEVSRFFPPDEWPRVRAILASPDEKTYDARMLDREGNLLEVENSRALINYEGRPAALVIVRDVTGRKRAERMLKENQERLQMALDGADFGLWEYLVDEDVLELPPKLFVGRYGYKPANVPKTSGQWLDIIHPEDRKRAQRLYKAFVSEGVEKLAYEYRVHDAGGAWRWIAVQGRALERGPDGTAKRLLGFVQDITQRKASEHALRELATKDSMTGLANRRHFLDMAGREMRRSKRYRTPLALVMFDADRFKRVNDTYGHDVGDEVLRAIASIGLKGIRDVDLFGRLGGEEFALLLPETGLDRAAEVAERLRQAYEDAVVEAGGNTVRFTVSFGVAEAQSEDTVDTLLRRADEAMYAAKQAGRNLVRTA